MSELSDLENIEVIHSFNESDNNKKKNKTDFVKKSIGAYSHELISEDIMNKWSQIANDVFSDVE